MSLLSIICRLLVSSLVYGTLITAFAFALTYAFRRRLAPAAVAAIWTVVLLKFLVPIAPSMPSQILRPMQHALPTMSLLLADPTALANASTGTASLSQIPALGGALFALWLLASGFFALRTARRNLSLRRELASLPQAPEDVCQLVEDRARSMGVRAPLVLIGGSSPFVAGLLRPRLVLPASAFGESIESSNALDAMVLHELAHLKRRDPWMRALQLVAEILFFFWPPLRFAVRRLEAAREQACDALALDRAAIQSRDYAQLLIDMHRRAVAMPQSALAMASRVSQLEGRIDMILENKIRRSSKFTALVVGAFTFLALAAGANASREIKGASSEDQREAAASKLLESGAARAHNRDYAGAEADLKACIELNAPVTGRLCNRNLAVVLITDGRGREAVAPLKVYQPYCLPAECATIEKLIARYGK